MHHIGRVLTKRFIPRLGWANKDELKENKIEMNRNEHLHILACSARLVTRRRFVSSLINAKTSTRFNGWKLGNENDCEPSLLLVTLWPWRQSNTFFLAKTCVRILRTVIIISPREVPTSKLILADDFCLILIGWWPWWFGETPWAKCLHSSIEDTSC